MSVYKIPQKIKKFEIFRPKTTLKRWYDLQTNKPDILFNASLYTSTNQPCGTIWNDGVLVSDQGKGFGFGTVDKKTVEFGLPWDKKWYDYITGYYGLIQNGVKIEKPWNDKAVFDTPADRIAFGKLKDGTLAIACENGVVIDTFSDSAIKSGFCELCNLDGGGSRALLWMGKWIYTSKRVPYNAVAIWLDDAGDDTMKVRCEKKTSVYNMNGKLEANRYIDAGDICDLYMTVDPNVQVKITYPVSNGNRTAYVKDLENFKAL